MPLKLNHKVYLSAAEREAGVFVELSIDDETLLVEVPARTPEGAVLKVKKGEHMLRVKVCERDWGIDGEVSLQHAPRNGEMSGDGTFWQRAQQELVESYRSDKTLAGAVYIERRDDIMVLTGLTRRAVVSHNDLHLDPSWGALLWTARPGFIASLGAFSEEQKLQAKRLGCPIIHIRHSALSPKSAASLVFPVGVRSLALFAGLNGLLAIDKRKRGKAMLLGRALSARIVYPNGQIFPIGHSGASLPRDLYDQAAFRVDQSLGQAKKRADQLIQDFVRNAAQGPFGKG